MEQNYFFILQSAKKQQQKTPNSLIFQNLPVYGPPISASPPFQFLNIFPSNPSVAQHFPLVIPTADDISYSWKPSPSRERRQNQCSLVKDAAYMGLLWILSFLHSTFFGDEVRALGFYKKGEAMTFWDVPACLSKRVSCRKNLNESPGDQPLAFFFRLRPLFS